MRVGKAALISAATFGRSTYKVVLPYGTGDL